MRDWRNVLHVGLLAARKKQKRNCGGVGKRVPTDFQGMGNAQNGREPKSLYQTEKANDQPVSKSERENQRTAALLPQNNEGKRGN
jgi:hypothetical protein